MPAKLVISNQRGGVAKTTTTLMMARYLAGKGKKILVIDTDPQGSIVAVLGLKPTAYLYDFLIKNYRFEECLTEAPYPGIDIMCSNRHTQDAEHQMLSQVFREFTFDKLFTPHDSGYEVVLIDVAPSISLLQACAMVYCRNVLVPIAMDTLSLQGASAAINAAAALNMQALSGVQVRTVGLLPVMVNARLQMTDVILRALQELATKHDIPILPSIRQDVEVNKAARFKTFPADHAPSSRAVADYALAAEQLMEILEADSVPAGATAQA